MDNSIPPHHVQAVFTKVIVPEKDHASTTCPIVRLDQDINFGMVSLTTLRSAKFISHTGRQVTSWATIVLIVTPVGTVPNLLTLDQQSDNSLLGATIKGDSTH